MLTAMIDAWGLWLLLVGFAVGVAVTAVLLWRLPRREDDVSDPERRVEAAWIAGTIERHGGIAPESLVEEVLDLHQAYLRAPHVPGPPRGAVPPPLPPAPPVAPPGPPPAGPPPGYVPPPGSAAPTPGRQS